MKTRRMVVTYREVQAQVASGKLTRRQAVALKNAPAATKYDAERIANLFATLKLGKLPR